MRIIAGIAKGTRLAVPTSGRMRPSSERVRESLFSILGGRLLEARCLDLYAGTGALGIEALSRGAQWCDFVDSDRDALETLATNLRASGLAARGKVWSLSLPGGLARVNAAGETYDLVFADPPYADEPTSYTRLCQEIISTQLLSPSGRVMIEHSARLDEEADWGGFRCTRCQRYGDTAVSFLELST